MKFLIVGLGSIGQRHARNIHNLKLGEIIAYRTTNNPLKFFDEEVIKKVYTNYDDALLEKPDVTIISNPTSMHIPFALKAAENGSHLLIEKPLSDKLGDIDKLLEIAHKNNLKVLMGCNLRFLPCMGYIKQAIDTNRLGKIYHIQAIFGKHIETWHPWEDYKQSYACRKDLGGGIILTAIHELDYIYWLFGLPLKIISNKSNNLGLDVEDSADILMTLKDGITANIHLDCVNNRFNRSLSVIGECGTLFYDIKKQEVSIYADGLEIKRVGSTTDFEDSYRTELLYLLECIKEDKKTMNSIEDGKEVLKIALGAKYD